jgi:hypothetical protein
MTQHVMSNVYSGEAFMLTCYHTAFTYMQNAEAYQVLHERSRFKERNRLFLLAEWADKVNEPRTE